MDGGKHDMSILIKGIEIPKNCKECFACKAELSQEKKVIYVCCFTQIGCPLISVPSHGDLIDANKLIELCDIMADKCDDNGMSIWHQFKTTVEWSPIVIPAEEDET